MGRELGYSGEQLQTFVKEEKAEDKTKREGTERKRTRRKRKRTRTRKRTRRKRKNGKKDD